MRSRQALNDDLNTAQALGVVFELVRDANTSIDAGEFRNEDAKAVLECLENANEFFDVLPDASLEKPTGAATISSVSSDGELGAEEIERQIAARHEARANQKFRQWPIRSAKISKPPGCLWRIRKRAFAGDESNRGAAFPAMFRFVCWSDHALSIPQRARGRWCEPLYPGLKPESPRRKTRNTFRHPIRDLIRW